MSAALASVHIAATTAAVTAVVGLVSGTAGGVLAAGQIARRSARAKDRYESETTLHGVLSTYLAQLAYDRAEVYRTGAYPLSYADPAAQVKLALTVLRELPHLKRRLADPMRDGLQQLVGRVALTVAEARLYVPADRLDRDNENQWLEQMKQTGQFDDTLNSAQPYGLLGAVWGSKNEPERRDADYGAAEATLTNLIGKVRPQPRRTVRVWSPWSMISARSRL